MPCVCFAGLKSARLSRAASTSGVLPCGDEFPKKWGTGGPRQCNPRAAVFAHGHKGGWQRLGDENNGAARGQQGRQDERAERVSEIEGFRVAQKSLSERVERYTLGKGETCRDCEQSTNESLSDIPQLQPAPPDLYRKGTIFGATSEGMRSARGEHMMRLLNGCSEKLLNAHPKSRNQSKPVMVNDGVSPGNDHRAFWTL